MCVEHLGRQFEAHSKNFMMFCSLLFLPIVKGTWIQGKKMKLLMWLKGTGRDVLTPVLRIIWQKWCFG